MNRWLTSGVVIATVVVAGCLPSPIGDPATSRIDPTLEGTWLHDGLELAQCQIGGMEYGPGKQKSIYLARAFDERCYLITAIRFYEANDGRIGPFGPGGDAGLTSWKGWLATLGDRRYLVCQKLGIAPIPPGPRAGWFPTFEVEQLEPNAVRVTPVVFGDIFQRLEGASPDEARAIIAAEFAQDKLEARIREKPDAAAPGDPRPLELTRVNEGSRALVERVLALFHLADSRAAQTPPQAAAAVNAPEPRLDGPYDVRTIPEDLAPPTELSDRPGQGKVFMDLGRARPLAKIDAAGGRRRHRARAVWVSGPGCGSESAAPEAPAQVSRGLRAESPAALGRHGSGRTATSGSSGMPRPAGTSMPGTMAAIAAAPGQRLARTTPPGLRGPS